MRPVCCIRMWICATLRAYTPTTASNNLQSFSKKKSTVSQEGTSCLLLNMAEVPGHTDPDPHSPGCPGLADGCLPRQAAQGPGIFARFRSKQHPLHTAQREVGVGFSDQHLRAHLFFTSSSFVLLPTTESSNKARRPPAVPVAGHMQLRAQAKGDARRACDSGAGPLLGSCLRWPPVLPAASAHVTDMTLLQRQPRT
jgi:hypothetical protein